MNSTKLLLLAALITACGNTISEKKDTEQVPLPPEGLIKAFDDTPGVAKAEIRDAKDRIITTGYYLNGKKESSWVEYFPHNGMIRTVTSYVQDKKEGLFLEFNASNQLWRRCTFHNDVRYGEYREYSGAIVRENRNYENGKLEGVSRTFYDDGKVLEEAYYKDGLREGVSKWYDQNGNLTIQYEYKKGELVKK